VSVVPSSFQHSAPGSFTIRAPIESPGCQTMNTPPVGSAITAIRPAVSTSNGGSITFPPSSAARSAAWSALSTVTYEFHTGGTPASARCGCCGEIAAASRPFFSIIE
jgi:hypothetical protein